MPPTDCLFCNIAAGNGGALLVDEEDIVAFNDIDPKAPHHILIIPRRHIATLNDVTPADTPLLGNLVQVAKRLAQEKNIAAKGYRLVFNCNRDGGQAVFHIHLHLLGGRQMQWPPG